MNTYMIDLEPYCENCEGFKVDVEEFSRYENNIKHLDRWLTCEYIKRCKAMYRHLDTFYKKEKESSDDK